VDKQQSKFLTATHTKFTAYFTLL